MKNQTIISENTKKLTGVAVFSALAFGVSLITNIPVGFLTFDAKDAIITIASFIYGPISAVFMSFITALLEMVTVGNTGPYGALMDFISTLSFTLTASVIYHYNRKMSGAIISLSVASLVYVAIMMPANLLITPLYMGVKVADVKALIPTMLLPFNIAKALMNSALVMLIYKHISKLVRRVGFAEPSKGTVSSFSKRDTIITISCASAAFVVAVIIFIILKNK